MGVNHSTVQEHTECAQIGYRDVEQQDTVSCTVLFVWHF